MCASTALAAASTLNFLGSGGAGGMLNVVGYHSPVSPERKTAQRQQEHTKVLSLALGIELFAVRWGSRHVESGGVPLASVSCIKGEEIRHEVCTIVGYGGAAGMLKVIRYHPPVSPAQAIYAGYCKVTFVCVCWKCGA
jgi:hypothetical protein